MQVQDRNQEKEPLAGDRKAIYPKYRVAIVGGGFSGARAEYIFSDRHDIELTVYDSKAYREFTPSILRALVHPEHSDFILHSTIGRPNWEVAEVKAVTRDAVVLVNGDHRPFDYCIVSSGSSYDTPIKSGYTTKAERMAEIEMWSKRIDKAETITVVGGGYVGVELAAEIVGRWPTGKRCVLVTSGDKVLSGCPAKVQDYSERWLTNKGVEIIFNEKVEMPDNSGDPTIKKSIALSDGRELKTDMAIKCIGFSPNNGVLNAKDFPGAFIENKLHVDHLLRVVSSDNVYAVGDVAVIPGESCDKTVLPATWSADAAAKNVLRVIDHSDEKLYPSMRMPNVLCVSLYSRDGALLFDDWLVLTGLIAAFVKWFLETFGVMVMRGNCIAIKVMDAAQYTTLTIANAGHRANSCLSGWCRRK